MSNANFRFDSDHVAINFNSLSDEERIKAARVRSIARSQNNNAEGHFSFDQKEIYWHDFAGDGSSHHDADILLSLLQLLEEPKFFTAKGSWITFDNPNNGGFDPRLGAWTRKSHADMRQVIATIDEVRQLIDARIAELGLDPVLVWEFCADSTEESFGDIHAYMQWRNSSLEQRTARFKMRKESSHE